MSDILTEVRFWAMVGEIQRRTLVCSPELESRVKGWIDARGLGGTFTVKVSTVVPDDRILVIDEAAGQAYLNQTIQSWARNPFPRY